MFYLQELCEFQIDETFRVPEVGTVVGGLLTKGVITEGAELLIGKSMQKQNVPWLWFVIFYFTTVTMKVLSFSDAVSYTLEDRCQSYGVNYGFYPQGRGVVFHSEDGQHIPS
jgi:hypothetical protein